LKKGRKKSWGRREGPSRELAREITIIDLGEHSVPTQELAGVGLKKRSP